MKREGLQGTHATSAAQEMLSPNAVLRPISMIACGEEVLEELAIQAVALDDPHAEAFDAFLEDLKDRFDAALLAFVAVKFGIITSSEHESPLRIMLPARIAQRMLQRFEMDPDEFREALTQVLQEEQSSVRRTQEQNLDEFEALVLHEIDELSMLSQNGALKEVMNFAADLDHIFQGRACLFSYLELRYSTYFGRSRLTPQELAVQICLDYLSYREEYQIGIINDYEQIVRSYSPENGPRPGSVAPSSVLQ